MYFKIHIKFSPNISISIRIHYSVSSSLFPLFLQPEVTSKAQSLQLEMELLLKIRAVYTVSSSR